MKKILDSIVVLDLTRFFSGPQATLLLAGMGAEVIKIDDPKTGDPTVFAPPYDGPGGISFERRSDQDMGLAYLKRARGKKSITIDLKSGRGREIFLNLAAKADVVIENFSPGEVLDWALITTPCVRSIRRSSTVPSPAMARRGRKKMPRRTI